ncbi:MAG TPA: hypothetical protein VFE14_05515, partial [Micromonosporaceae bacterium]|nr:hypothetical protein [Micromonosporaceae bacterium]
KSSTWSYSYFDLKVKNEKGDAGKGSPTDIRLYSEPETAGSWGAGAGQDPWYPWHVRGTQVGYTPLGLTVFKERDNHTLTVAALPTCVVLDPHVMLVPLQVIRVVPQDQSSSYYKWITQGADERQLRNWLDQTRSIERQGVTHPGGILATSNYIDNTPSLWTMKRPDDIWAQAQIQWRLISFRDLAVADEAHYLPTTCSDFANDAIWKANYYAALQQGLIKQNVPTLFIALQVTASNCIVNGLGGLSPPLAAIGLNSQNLTASHELGHVLNLDHPCGGGDTLMCKTSAGSTISATSRMVARKQAAIYVKSYWGVDVQP